MSVVRIGPYTLPNRLILAPMAGVTDRPFRQLCRRLGAGMVVSEMVTSDVRLWNSRKSRLRLIHDGEDEPRSVQIAGGDPAMLAEAAQRNVELGAQIIDINMGCPAKKVCNKAAGSALLRDEALVAEILDAVVRAVDVPVTLKIRTGWDRDNRNGVTVAKLAEQAGIRLLRCMAGPAPTCTPGRRSTRPSRRSSRPCRYRCSPMATSIRRKRPGKSSSRPGWMPC